MTRLQRKKCDQPQPPELFNLTAHYSNSKKSDMETPVMQVLNRSSLTFDP